MRDPASMPVRTSDESVSADTPPPRLLDQVRARIRYRHYSIRTERAYVDWTRRFVLFHGKRHPRDMGAIEVEAFLSHLANERGLAASSHQQALAALLFLYQQVLGLELPWLSDIGRPKQSKRIPVVLTVEEVRRVLSHMEGTHGTLVRLIYGTGMRLMECVRLRVKDVDFARREVLVRDGKGGKDRVTMLPVAVPVELRGHADRACGRAGVELPRALRVKYPKADAAWAWFSVFRRVGCQPTLARR